MSYLKPVIDLFHQIKQIFEIKLQPLIFIICIYYNNKFFYLNENIFFNQIWFCGYENVFLFGLRYYFLIFLSKTFKGPKGWIRSLPDALHRQNQFWHITIEIEKRIWGIWKNQKCKWIMLIIAVYIFLQLNGNSPGNNSAASTRFGHIFVIVLVN